jgi:hypothetical protein
VKPWSEARAWDITQRAEAYMRERQPKGWKPSPEEDRRIEDLLARRSLAGKTRDMRLWEMVHLELVELAVGSWNRYREGTGGG